MAAQRAQVIQTLERMGLTEGSAFQVMGGEVIVEGDCGRLGGFQKRLEAEGIDSTLDVVEEEASWVTHTAGRSASNCVILYSLRIPVN